MISQDLSEKDEETLSEKGKELLRTLRSDFNGLPIEEEEEKLSPEAKKLVELGLARVDKNGGRNKEPLLKALPRCWSEETEALLK